MQRCERSGRFVDLFIYLATTSNQVRSSPAAYLKEEHTLLFFENISRSVSLSVCRRTDSSPVKTHTALGALGGPACCCSWSRETWRGFDSLWFLPLKGGGLLSHDAECLSALGVWCFHSSRPYGFHQTDLHRMLETHKHKHRRAHTCIKLIKKGSVWLDKTRGRTQLNVLFVSTIVF